MDVMGLGTYAMDVMIRVDTLPTADGFCVVKSTTRLPGGSGTNVIVQLARLGASCGYLAKIGDDQVGSEVVSHLRKEGISADTLRVQPGGTSLYTEIVVDEAGDKFIMLNMGDACLSYAPEEVDLEAVRRARVLYTDMIPGKAAAYALKDAHANGVKTAFNMQVGLATMEGLGISAQDILSALADVDVFAPCRDGLYALCGTKDPEACLRFLRPYFGGVLLLTLGSEGAVAFDREDRRSAVPARSIRPTDTTGAGDSFMGAFIDAYLLRGEDVSASLNFATDCAAYTCCGLGARSSPTRAQIKAWEAQA